MNSLSIDCLASQGNHLPAWITSNDVVGTNGIIPERSENEALYGTDTLSNYTARLSFDYFEEDFSGTYTCISGKSNAFAEIYVTTGKLLYK